MLRIGINAGHGGSNHGTQDKDIIESVYVFDVAQKVERILTERGRVQPVMIRVEDIDLSNSEAAAVAYKFHCHAVVDIHVNASKNPERHGTEAYYQPGDRHGFNLGKAILSRLPKHKHTVSVMADDRTPGARDVLRAYKSPATLIELGFRTNAVDKKWLLDPSTPDLLATAIADGIEGWAAEYETIGQFKKQQTGEKS